MLFNRFTLAIGGVAVFAVPVVAAAVEMLDSVNAALAALPF